MQTRYGSITESGKYRVPERAWQETGGPRIIAMARRDPGTQTISLILDAANIAAFAIAAHAGNREAHVREVERFGVRLPEDSYSSRTARPSSPGDPDSCRLRAVETPTGRRTSATS